jgi:hypothetical protein
MTHDDQPFIDHWPIWDEPLSKVAAPFDIAGARWKLARKFNVRPPEIPPSVREREIERAWDQHRRGGGRS